MGLLTSVAVAALSGVSCLAVSEDSRMVIPQIQIESATTGATHTGAFSSKEIRIPGKLGIGLDEPASNNTISTKCKTVCESPSTLDPKSCECVAASRRP